MNSDSLTTGNARDLICDHFVHELHDAAEPEAVLEKFVSTHPELAQEFRELAAMAKVMKQAQPAPDQSLPDILEGRLGEFRIVRKLEVGGMGEIYEARQERLNRSVALKIIRRGHVSHETRDRFLREQQVLARLHQTHIVPIHTAGDEGPLQYLVMPFIRGFALRHIIQAALHYHFTRPESKTPPLAGLVQQELSEQAASECRGAGQAISRETPCPSATTATRLPPNWRQFAGAAGNRGERLALSSAYFRSVAQVIADVAEALHHAHQAGVLHRDVKPANIMVDASGHCWLIDFGLAGLLHADEERQPAASLPPLAADMSVDGSIKGTLPYMAPEQFEGQADARTDIWGLGVTLYELLTLERAFDGSLVRIHEQIFGAPASPDPARSQVRNVPADLAAICRKATQKAPQARYATALAMAEDLRRWLRGEPTQALPVSAPRRAFLWARRNKGWAAALGFGVLALATIVGSGFYFEMVKANEAERSANLQKQKLFLHDLATQRHADLLTGWSERQWSLLRAHPTAIGKDVLQPHALAILAGLDARRVKHFEATAASSVAFDRTGRWLLLGGLEDKHSNCHERAKLWDSANDKVVVSEQPGSGPVAFRGDGTPLQLVVADDRRRLLLWDVARQQQAGALAIPEQVEVCSSVDMRLPLLALSADGSLAAAVVSSVHDERAGARQILVWETASGMLRHQLQANATVNALTLSRDNSLLASGDVDGRLSLWSLVKGSRLATFPGRLTVSSLAFSPDAGLTARAEEAARAGRLAVGRVGGDIGIWDLADDQRVALCRGSPDNVFALAFSPDGTMLASGGRQHASVWDSFTGRMLLEIAGDYHTGIAFDPLGTRLALATKTVFAKGEAAVCELGQGPGIRTLRGLRSNVYTARFSPDGRWLAALAQNWQIAVWDAGTGELRHLLNPPAGRYIDHVDLAFSGDGRLAYATAAAAKMWDVGTGQELQSWKLAPGSNTALAFRDAGQLLLLRAETRDQQGWPDDETDPRDHPRVCRLRDLLAPDPAAVICESADFRWYVDHITACPGGDCFLIVGSGRRGEPLTMTIVDGRTGRTLNSPPAVGRLFDPTGKLLLAANDRGQFLFESLTGKLAGPGPTAMVLGPEAQSWVGAVEPRRCGYFQSGNQAPRLVVDQEFGQVLLFNRDGTRVVFGSAGGGVYLCDLPEINKRLTAVGLGW